MTTEATQQNELIRYPVSVNDDHPWMVLDRNGNGIIEVDSTDDDTGVAAELVRILTAHHARETAPPQSVALATADITRALGAASYPANTEGMNEREVSTKAIKGLTALQTALETEQTMHQAWRKRAEEAEQKLMARETASKASVAGEPSDAAMRAARMWYDSGALMDDEDLARSIDSAFAAERAEAANRIEILERKSLDAKAFFVTAEEFNALANALNRNGCVPSVVFDHAPKIIERLEEKIETAEHERDEARAEAKHHAKLADGNSFAADNAEARVKELEAVLTTEKQSRATTERYALEKISEAERNVCQLRADLDEAVVILKNWCCVSGYSIYARRTKVFLARLSKPSEPKEAAAPPEPATESGEVKSVRYEDIEGPVRYTVTGDHVEYTPNQPEPATESGETIVTCGNCGTQHKRSEGHSPCNPVLSVQMDTIATLRQQLAERDAEIETWKKRDRIKDEQLKTAGRRAKQWRHRCGLAEAHRVSVIELESALRNEEGEAAEQALRK